MMVLKTKAMETEMMVSNSSRYLRFSLYLFFVFSVVACTQEKVEPEKQPAEKDTSTTLDAPSKAPPEEDPEFVTRVAGFNKKTGARQISPQELAKKLSENEKVILIDVREEKEYQVSSLSGSKWIPPANIASQDKPENLDDVTVVTFCTVGYRSGMAARALELKWGKPVFNLDGGIIRWFNFGNQVIDPATKKAVDKIHPYDASWGKYVKER